MKTAPPRYPWLLACLGVDAQTTSMLDRDYRPPPLPAGWHPVTWADLAGDSTRGTRPRHRVYDAAPAAADRARRLHQVPGAGRVGRMAV